MQTPWWRDIFIEPSSLIAGFCGGLVKALISTGTPEPWQVVSSVIIGALTANYLSPILAGQIGTKGGATPFLVGLGSMWICQSALMYFRKWSNGTNGKT